MSDGGQQPARAIVETLQGEHALELKAAIDSGKERLCNDYKRAPDYYVEYLSINPDEALPVTKVNSHERYRQAVQAQQRQVVFARVDRRQKVIGTRLL